VASKSIEMKQPVIYGEVLFDRFPDGSAVLGGAPFNVAWHLQGFGLQPLFISRVGSDAAGDAVVEAMQAWGMDATGVQHDDAYPTGAVEVSLQDGQPRFDILSAQAYDYIDGSEIPSLGDTPLIYYGTLIARSRVSREGLETLRRKCVAPGFVDINLRPPWWTPEVVEHALRDAHWAKLNQDELSTLAGRDISRETLAPAARDLCAQHALEFAIVTLGEAGAAIVGSQTEEFASSPPVQNLVDTVGAGDAFSAVSIAGLVQRWPLDVLLRRALAFAARICEQRGATRNDPALYESTVEAWQRE
jgi:fructokinase